MKTGRDYKDVERLQYEIAPHSSSYASATDSRPPPDLADTWRSHASGNAADAKPRSQPPNEGHS